MSRQDWTNRALCANHPLADTWTQPKPRGPVPKHIARTCQACPVKTECLQDEITYAAQTFRWIYRPAGYRAGLTPRQITQMIRAYLKLHPVKGKRK